MLVNYHFDESEIKDLAKITNTCHDVLDTLKESARCIIKKTKKWGEDKYLNGASAVWTAQAYEDDDPGSIAMTEFTAYCVLRYKDKYGTTPRAYFISMSFPKC